MAAPSDHGLSRAAQRASASLAVGVLVTALGWGGLVWWPRAQLPRALAEEIALTARIEAARALPQPREVDGLLARLHAEGSRIDAHLATLGEASELAHTIRSLALASGLDVRSEGSFVASSDAGALNFRPNGHGPPQHFRKRLLLAGDFRSLRRFLAAVEALPDLLHVASLELKRASGGPSLEIEVELDVAKAAPTGGGRMP